MVKAGSTALVMAWVLVGLVSLASVFAFQSSGVSGRATFAVVSTDSAALALTPGTGNAANQATVTGGVLRVDFRRAYGGDPFTLQKDRTGSGVSLSGDDLRMRGVFKVTNNGSTCQDVTAYVSGGGPSHLAAIYGRLPSDSYPGTRLAGAGGAQVGGAAVQLGTAAESRDLLVDFWWLATDTGFAASGTFTVQVSGEASATCP